MDVRRRDWASWLMGLALGAIALGQSLRPGSVLNLDFVLLPHAPVPEGFWGLGSELPRRTPLLLPLAWLDPLLGSVLVGKLLVVLCISAMFVGAGRLVATTNRWSHHLAGLLYALSPFTMTRLAVGHLFVLAAMAVLPWVVQTLLDPLRDSRRLYLGALAMGLTGSFGGLLAGLVVIAGLVGRAGRFGLKVRALTVVLMAQIPWLVPGLVVYAQGTRIAGSGSFATDLSGVGGPLRLLAGHGFWQRSFQVGGTSGIAAPLLGVALLGLALLGHRRLPRDLGRLGWLGGLALAWVLVSGLDLTRGVYSAVTSWPGGAIMREGQRMLVPAVLWLAVSAASSVPELARRATGHGEVLRAAPVAVVALLVAPGAWGAGGQMRSVELPSGWYEAREIVRADAGPVLALPWFEYLALEVAEGRTVLNPLPIWLGGDVLTSSDPRLPGEAARERRDPREAAAAELVARNLRGEPIGDELAALGVRWVVNLVDGDLVRGHPVGVLQSEALQEDPQLDRVLTTEDIEVYAVRAWPGPLVLASGDPAGVDPVVTPLARVDESGPGAWARSAASGWMRGWRAAGATDSGSVALPAGGTIVWFWPTVVVLLGYLLTAVVTVLALRRGPRRAERAQ